MNRSCVAVTRHLKGAIRKLSDVVPSASGAPNCLGDAALQAVTLRVVEGCVGLSVTARGKEQAIRSSEGEGEVSAMLRNSYR